MYWANFLHIYQPPTQKPYWVKRVTEESYRKIVAELKRAPGAKLTLNISAVLVELLDKNGCGDVIDDIRLLLERGQIELTSSAKFHPLLPKIPKDEVIRQIQLNDETHRKYFGELYKPKGFFPPEMAFSTDVAKIVKELGYEWIIVDELSFSREIGNIDYSKRYTVEGLDDFSIYFRERRMSYKILSGQLGSGSLLIQSLGDRLKKNEYLLTAMDGETFGHHRPGMEHLLFEIYESKELETILISDIPKHFPESTPIDPLPSTWALMEKDLEKNAPFSRWLDPGNTIHERQWELTNLAIKAVHASDQSDPKFPEVRTALDRAIHSDQYWWASAKPWWSMEMIEAGAKELSDVVLNAPGSSEEEKERAKQLYQEIIYTGFDWQRSGLVEKLSQQEDEEIRQRTDEAIPELPAEEIDKIIANLRKDIDDVVKREEYERAAQLRNRIKELEQYRDKKSKE
ncbi:MAG: UvrB/UvrC motif-containing protein [Candidatus Nomurabacteria bacterium]|nr:MAG: UvrB/UvrC motif-containing protein [Candidatus Nomurabacteria bacterium]